MQEKSIGGKATRLNDFIAYKMTPLLLRVFYYPNFWVLSLPSFFSFPSRSVISLKAFCPLKTHSRIVKLFMSSLCYNQWAKDFISFIFCFSLNKKIFMTILL
jgi:hypothetical protein